MTRFFKLILFPISLFWEFKNLVLAVLVSGYVGYSIGHYAGGAEANDMASIKAVGTDIKIEEEQNEIRNHRPDRSGVVKRLREGNF